MKWIVGTDRGPVGLLAPVCAVLLLLACGGQDGALQRAGTISDSAGVRIVSHTDRVSPVVYRVESDPALVLGADEENPDERFTQVVAARRLAHGALVVLDAGENLIRWFSAAGELIVAAGGTGDGPGEYRALRDLYRLPGDSIFVVDRWTGRVATYGPTGVLDSSWIPTAPGQFTSVRFAGRTPRGDLFGMVERAEGEPTGSRRYRAILTHHAVGGGLDTLGDFPGGESYWEACGPDNRGVCNVGVPYGLQTSAAVVGEMLAVANGEYPELALFRAGAGQVASWRLTPRAVPLRSARRTAWIDSILAPMPADRQLEPRERLTRAPVRATLPEIEGLVADPDGVLWVARPLPEGAAEREWELLAWDGTHLGRVMVPATLRVLDVGHGYITGITVDEDGRELIVSHRLVPGR